MPEHRDPLVRSAVVALLDASPMPPSWAEIEELATESRQQRQTARNGWVIAVAVAVAVILMIAIPALLLGGRDATPVDVPSTTVPEVTTTATGTTEAIDGVAPLTTWDRVGGEVMDPVVGIFRAARTSDGFIAVGFDPGEEDFRQNGVIFTSTDGVTWERLAEDDPDLLLGAILMYGVTEGGPGFVAVGMGCEDDNAPCPAHPTVWTSVDGTDWDRSAPDLEVFGEIGAMLDVISSSHGLVAAGNLQTENSDGALVSAPAVWLSADGLTWEKTWVGDPAADTTITPAINAVAEGPDGALIAVGEAEGPAGTLTAGMWRSEDGRVWHQVLDPALASASGRGLVLSDVAYGPEGFVAIGTEGQADPAMWHSSDGASWTRVDTADQPFGGSEALSSVTATEGGYLLTGDHGFMTSTSSQVWLWSSPDGLSWDRVLSLGEGYTMSVIATPTVIVLTGAMPFDDDFHASVWAGPMFDPLDPPPDPISAADETAADKAATVRIWAEPAGLSCAELAESGYRYVEVAAYWERFGRPDLMDPNGDGAPCIAEFLADDVAMLFGADGSSAMNVVIDDDGPTLTGDAVDEGTVCPSVSVEVDETDTTGDPAALWHNAYVFTCEDESGTFTIGFDIYLSDSDTMFEYGTWTIIRGTGDYAALGGGGTVSSGPDENWMWVETFNGRVTPKVDG